MASDSLYFPALGDIHYRVDSVSQPLTISKPSFSFSEYKVIRITPRTYTVVSIYAPDVPPSIPYPTHRIIIGARKRFAFHTKELAILSFWYRKHMQLAILDRHRAIVKEYLELTAKHLGTKLSIDEPVYRISGHDI